MEDFILETSACKIFIAFFISVIAEVCFLLLSSFSRAAVGAYHKLKFIFRENITQIMLVYLTLFFLTFQSFKVEKMIQMTMFLNV